MIVPAMIIALKRSRRIDAACPPRQMQSRNPERCFRNDLPAAHDKKSGRLQPDRFKDTPRHHHDMPPWQPTFRQYPSAP